MILDSRMARTQPNIKQHFIICVVPFLENCSSYNSATFTVKQNWQISAAAPLYTKAASSIEECKCFCGNDPNCSSFYYHDATKKCDLGTELDYMINAGQTGYETGFKNGSSTQKLNFYMMYTILTLS